jgi:hypothetical protein
VYIGDLLGLAEGLGKCGFFLIPPVSKLWVKNGVEVRVDDSICGQTMRADWARRYVQEAASAGPKRMFEKSCQFQVHGWNP